MKTEISVQHCWPFIYFPFYYTVIGPSIDRVPDFGEGFLSKEVQSMVGGTLHAWCLVRPRDKSSQSSRLQPYCITFLLICVSREMRRARLAKAGESFDQLAADNIGDLVLVVLKR